MGAKGTSRRLTYLLARGPYDFRRQTKMTTAMKKMTMRTATTAMMIQMVSREIPPWPALAGSLVAPPCPPAPSAVTRESAACLILF